MLREHTLSTPEICRACNELKTDESHDSSDNHLKNVALFEFGCWRGLHYEKENDITIFCNAESSNTLLYNCVDSKIHFSVRPEEIIQLDFTIRNDSANEDLFINFIQAIHSRLSYLMTNQGLEIGSTPHCIRPNETLGKEICIMFTSPHVGQYEYPILFSFKKMSKENIYIFKDIIVVVEDTPLLDHDDIIENPFTDKPVNAETLYKANHRKRFLPDQFNIPKEKKKIFSQNLVYLKNTTSQEKALAKDLKQIFDTGPTAKNYVNFFHNLLWFEETIARTHLQRYNMSAVTLERVCDNYLLVVPGLAEKRPSLVLGDLVYVKPSHSNKAMFEGIISEVLGEAIYIRGFHREFRNYYSPARKYDIQFLSNRVSLERIHKGLCTGQREGMFLRAFPQPNRKVPKIKQLVTFYNPMVKENKEQRCVVEHILAGSSGIAPYLIHGPPGTGKTVTVVESILQIIGHNPKNRVLVCTDSNMAADHVAVQILKYASYFNKKGFLLRANSRFRNWDTMPAVLGPYSNGTSQNDWSIVSMDKFTLHQVVVTTLVHSALYANARRDRGWSRHITHLFIDEAAQAMEPLTLLPACGLLSQRGTLVLAGDPKQLGPVVTSTAAKIAGLGISLMERLRNTCELYSDERNDPNYMVMLRKNFRSHPDIIELPNKLFYNDQLQDCADKDPLSTVNVITGVHDCHAIVFHAVLSSEQKLGKSPSYFNSVEQSQIRCYVLALVDNLNVPVEDIGIITPYIRQVQMIRYWLNIKRFDKIEVGTVEAFQGKEKRFILISTVRANADLLSHDAKYQLGFLVDEKRFNVAITRAKTKVIVIGNPLCLTLDAKWRMFIQRCRQLGSYYGFDYEMTNNTMVFEDLTSNLSRLLKHQSSQGEVSN